MGATIWVDVRGRSQEDCPRDNSTLLQCKDPLDRMSEKLGVRKLSEFYDYSVLEGELFRPLAIVLRWIRVFRGFGAEPSRDSWFDPAPALTAVRAIRRRLAQRPVDLESGEDASQPPLLDRLTEELEHCQDVLETAVSRDQSFRFLIVP